jgi:hypothetical protein
VRPATAVPTVEEPAARPESSWHLSARIVYPGPGKSVRLNDQSEESRWLNKILKTTTSIPYSIPTDLVVSRPHDVFEQLPIPADLDFSAHFFPRPDQNLGHSTSAALGTGDQEFNLMIDTGYS